jgi:hypothetical protein
MPAQSKSGVILGLAQGLIEPWDVDAITLDIDSWRVIGELNNEDPATFEFKAGEETHSQE